MLFAVAGIDADGPARNAGGQQVMAEPAGTCPDIEDAEVPPGEVRFDHAGLRDIVPVPVRAAEGCCLLQVQLRSFPRCERD